MKKFTTLFLLPVLLLTLLVTGCGGKDKFTVTFASDGGTKVASQEIEKGKYATEPEEPTKEGYTFIAWYDGDEAWDFTNTITKNLKLTAHWKKAATEEKVTVTFDSSGGSAVSKQTITVDGKITKPTAPTKIGYVFLGWKNGNELWDFTQKVSKDMTLVASWQKKPTETGSTGKPVVPEKPKPDSAIEAAVKLLEKNGVSLTAGATGSSMIGSCTATWANPATLHHAIKPTTQDVSVTLTCGKDKTTKTAKGKISASPYYYTAVGNNNRLNYNVEVFKGTQEQSDYAIKTDAGRSKYIPTFGYAAIDNAYFQSGKVYTLLLNNDLINTYAIGQH